MKTEFYFSILSDNTVDLSPCFMLHFPDRVILVNAPEGIQRYLLERNIKRTKLCDIIFLDNEYDSVFGVWGLFLSFPEIEGNVINFHINESINRLVNILNKEKFVSKAKFHEIIYSENSYLNLTKISETTNTLESNNKNSNIPPPKKLTHHKFPITIEKLLFKIIKNKKLKQFYLYEITIIKVKNKRGAFSNNIATKFGIEGKNRHLLTSGNPVYSNKLNREVLPLEVIDSFKQGSLFIFIKETEIPILSYTKYKTTRKETFGNDIIKACKTLDIIERENNCPNKKLDRHIIINVFWLLNNRLESILYSNFQNDIQNKLKESEYFEKFFLNNNNKNNNNCYRYSLEEYIEYHRNRLNFIDLFNNEIYNFELLNSKYTYNEDYKIDLWKHPINNEYNNNNNINSDSYITNNIKRIKVTSSNNNYNNGNKKNIEIHFLGTCCAIPTLYRTFSSILISLNNHSILLDCGESTVNQLHYKFNKEQRLTILSKISIVFISHTHADHFSGLISLLRLIYKAKQETEKLNCIDKEITLILPPKVETWCKELFSYFKYQHIRKELNINFVNSKSINSLCIEHFDIMLFDVSHLPDSRGICIVSNFNSKISLVYTGDTKLDNKVRNELGGVKEFTRDSSISILIVESTFENILDEEARLRNHCTTKDSIEIGDIIKSDYTILTHISARSKGGSIEEKIEEIKDNDNVYIASDMSTFLF